MNEQIKFNPMLRAAWHRFLLLREQLEYAYPENDWNWRDIAYGYFLSMPISHFDAKLLAEALDNR